MRKKIVRFNKTCLTMIAVYCSLLCSSCDNHVPQTETITYSYEISENLTEMVNITILYVNQNGKLVAEDLTNNNWEKTIQVKRPFYAEMRIKCTPKTTFLPQKEYYSINRKLSINESVSFVQNTLSSRNLFDYIDNLCSRTQILFFEIK